MTVGRRFGREVRLADSVFQFFLCFQRWCTEIERHTLALRFFLSRLRTFPTLKGEKHSGRASLSANYCFRYIDSQISILNKFKNWHINSKITGVWHCDKLRLRPQRHGEQTLTFLYAVHPTWEQTVNSSKCSTVPGLGEGIR